MHYIDIETKEIESDTLGSTKQSPPRNSNAVGVKFKQVAFPREGRETPLTGVTIRASGGKHNTVNLEADLRLPNSGKPPCKISRADWNRISHLSTMYAGCRLGLRVTA